MKIFKCCKENIGAIAVAFNRGHAVKLLSRTFKERGIVLSKEDAVIEVPTETKGEVHILYERPSEGNLD